MTFQKQQPPKVLPGEMKFSLPYGDGSGERLSVQFLQNKPDIIIRDNERVQVRKSDIDWLINVLQTIKEVCEAEDYNAKKPGNTIVRKSIKSKNDE